MKDKNKDEKCAYLMVGIGQKGPDIYSTWNLNEDDRKSLKVHLEIFETELLYTTDTNSIAELRWMKKF
jgi:hypothetical protein